MPPGKQTTRPTPETTTVAPALSSTPAVDESNSSTLDETGLGAPVCVGGIEGLRNAVDAQDPDDAWNMFNALSGADMAVLKGDGTLTQGLLSLITDENAAMALWSLQYPPDLWLRLAGMFLTSEVVLARVLDDVGILTTVDIANNAELLQGLPAFHSQFLFDAIIACSSADEQAVLLSSDGGAQLVRNIYGASPLVVFPELAASSELVLDLYLDSEIARTWLLEDVAELSSFILTVWVTPGDWFRGVTPVHPEDMDLFVDSDQAGWGAGLYTALLQGNAEDAMLLMPPSDLSLLVIGTIALGSPANAAEVCNVLAFPVRESLILAQFGGWLSFETAQAMLLGSSIEDQVLVANDGMLVPDLAALGWIEEFMVEFVADQAQFSAAYAVVPALRAWMDMDRMFFGLLVTDPAVWVDAFIAGGAVDALLEFAANDPAAWRVAVSDAQLTSILGLMLKPCAEEHVAGLWALILEANRAVAIGMEAFYTLYGMRIWGSANQPERALGDWTSDPPGSITYERKQIWATVDPSQQALNDYMKMLVDMPRGQVATTAVGFGKGWNTHFKRKTPPADANWGDSKAAIFGDAGTSMYWDGAANFMLMYTNSTGGIDVEDDGTTPHWISGDQATAQDGNAGGVGGLGSTTDPLTGVVTPVPATTDNTLSYFENHAIHEHGHGVGNKSYAGMTMAKGDASAKAWAKWRDSDDAQMRSAYFAGAAGNVTDVMDNAGVDQTVPASEIGLWLTTILSTNVEPTAAAAPGTGGMMTGLFAGTRADRLSGIGLSSVGGKDLVKYVEAVDSHSSNDLKGGASEYPDFAPSTGTSYIYCKAEGGFRKYDKSVMTTLTASHGWYSLFSHSEMFAEIYTKHYATSAHLNPPTKNSVNWGTFFTQLEASPDSMLEAGVAPTVQGVGGAPGPAAPAPAPAPAPAVPGGPAPAPGSAPPVLLTVDELHRMATEGAVGSSI